GSVWVRGVFPNPKGLLTPGLFVRVRLPLGDPHSAVLIPERAIGTDQGEKFVYVVDDKDQARYRPLKLGAQPGQWREVKEGIKPGERVIVSGLQRVRIDPEKHFAQVSIKETKPDEGGGKKE